MDILSSRQNKILGLAGKSSRVMLTNYPSPSTFLLKLSGKINTIVIDGELPQKLKTACREHDVDTVIIDNEKSS